MGRTTIKVEKKIEIINEILKNRKTVGSVAREYGLSENTIRRYINLYNIHGVEGLQSAGKRNRTYTVSFKKKIISLVLKSGNVSKVSIQYNIVTSVVYKWLNEYNNNQLKDYKPQGEIYTMVSKKYSKEERQLIAKECIENGKDYKTICKKYEIAYSKIYQWVKKYEKDLETTPIKEAEANKEYLEILLTLKNKEIETLKAELEILKKNEEILESIQRKK